MAQAIEHDLSDRTLSGRVVARFIEHGGGKAVSGAVQADRVASEREELGCGIRGG